MSSIDIRIEDKQGINALVFAENNFDGHQAYFIFNNGINSNKYITIHNGSNCVEINSVEHALNLIKALNKAIELGWLE
jgi:hypothetical protein